MYEKTKILDESHQGTMEGYQANAAQRTQGTPAAPPACDPQRVVVCSCIAVTGIQWRLLPREFRPWQTVYYHFRRWSRLGHWQRIHHVLRALVRQKMNRHKHPTAGCLDSQSVKTTAVADVRGCDNGKKVNGRKRHLLCDTQGLALELVVTPANISESQGARLVCRKMGWRRSVTKKLRRVWVDAGYKAGAIAWCREKRGVELEVVGNDKERRWQRQRAERLCLAKTTLGH